MGEGQPLLPTAPAAAAIIGVSKHMFHLLRKREGFPNPIVLDPRAVRWRRLEIEAWVAALQPDTKPRPQPEQLARGRRGRRATPFDAMTG
jgi:predicted DNA-binding transcriptional regulator AlpA